MAISNPVYFKNGSIRRAGSGTVDAHIDFGVHLWGEGSARSVDLSNVASNGNMTRMLDYRDTAGDVGTEANATNNTRFNNNTPDAAVDAGTFTTYDRLNQDITTVNLSTANYPLKLTSGGDLQVMTYQDVLDTYINYVISYLRGLGYYGGHYLTSSSSTLAGHTKIGTNPIFVDQRFDPSVYGGGTAGTTITAEVLPLSSVDQPVTITSYYLYRKDAGSEPTITMPLYYNKSNNSIQQYSYTDFKSFLSNVIAYAAANETGYKLRYDIENSGFIFHRDIITPVYSGNAKTMGGAIADTTLNGSIRINDQDADNYRSVNAPAGTSEYETLYRLVLKRL